MKERLQQRVQELDPLPELLRTNELKLQDASERSALLEKRNSELQRNIQELNDKVCCSVHVHIHVQNIWHLPSARVY